MTKSIEDQPISTIIGKNTRIYKTGDILTKDHLPDRVNIELSSKGSIEKIWLG